MIWRTNAVEQGDLDGSRSFEFAFVNTNPVGVDITEIVVTVFFRADDELNRVQRQRRAHKLRYTSRTFFWRATKKRYGRANIRGEAFLYSYDVIKTG